MTSIRTSISKKIQDYCQNVIGALVRNNYQIDYDKFKHTSSFINDLFDNKYTLLVDGNAYDSIDGLQDKLDKLVDKFYKYLKSAATMNIDLMIECWDQLKIVVELEKQPNIVQRIKILPMYHKRVNDWKGCIKECKNSIINESPIENIDGFSNQNHNERRNYYEKIQQKLKFLERSLDVGKHIINLDKSFLNRREIFEACVGAVAGEIKSMHSRFVKTIPRDTLDTNIGASFAKIDVLYDQIMVLHEVGISTDNLAVTMKADMLEELGKVEQKFVEMVKDSSIENGEITVNRANCLLYLQKAVHHLSNDELKNVAMEKLRECLEELKRRKAFEFRNLSKELESRKWPENVYAKEIIRDYGMFDGQVTKWLNDKIQLRSIDAVMSNMQVNLDKSTAESTRNATKNLFKIFDTCYKELFSKILQGWDTNNSEIQNLQHLKVLEGLESLVREITKKADKKQSWDSNFNRQLKQEILNVMAHVLCIWTFLDSSYYWICVRGDVNSDNSDSKLNVDDEKDNRHIYQCLRQPHVVQVVAMIRLLGLHDLKDGKIGLNKKFVEIGTGEGKSLVVATIACVLGLIGWRVYCTNYSDFNNYRNLFHVLDIADKVFYGTFERLCEKFISQDINMISSVGKLFNGPCKNLSVVSDSNRHSNNDSNEKTMLIIDKVDVFFDSNTFGKTLTKAASIKNPHLSKICDLIWEKKSNISTWNDLKRQSNFDSLYQQCLKSFNKALHPRVEREINNMIDGVQTFTNAEKRKEYKYIVKYNKIGHRVNDCIDYNSNVGYKTLFAHYYENEAGRISNEALNNAKRMMILCGAFSYGQFPSTYTNIIGVTATLNKLSQSQKDFLESEYKISEKLFTFMPSVFKKAPNNNNHNIRGCQNNLKFNKTSDVKVFKQFIYDYQLVEQMKKQRHDGCPIIVFFYDNSELKNFAQSRTFQDSEIGKIGHVKVLNEQCSYNEKEQIICEACNLNAITLATRIFGRGTDFQVIDDQIESDLIGGPHVIQTFFSQEIAEEIQIQGRTARYGGKGSYSMILCQEMVEKQFGIRLKSKDIYQQLHHKRQQLQINQFKNVSNKIKTSKIQHEMSLQVLNALKTTPVVVSDVAKALDNLRDAVDGVNYKQTSSWWSWLGY